VNEVRPAAAETVAGRIRESGGEAAVLPLDVSRDAGNFVARIRGAGAATDPRPSTG